MCVWAVWREDEKDFGIRLCEVKLKIVWDGGVVVENLSEEYWFLDSFGADLGREKMGRNLSKFLSSWEFHILQKNFVKVFHIFGLIYAKNYGFTGIG